LTWVNGFWRVLISNLPGSDKTPQARRRSPTTTRIQTMANNREDETVPVMQRVLDNPFLLLFLGVTMPTVFYILWGVMEIVTIPLAK
jgi:hypothetical protein